MVAACSIRVAGTCEVDSSSLRRWILSTTCSRSSSVASPLLLSLAAVLFEVFGQVHHLAKPFESAEQFVAPGQS